MNVIGIEIKNKIAKSTGVATYVCGNSDYLIRFSFDDEWDQYDVKTARIMNGDEEYHDVVFTGNECNLPIISNAYVIKIGVYAGNLHTTTPAYIHTLKSILCQSGRPAEPTPDVYAQIMELLNSALTRIDALEKNTIVRPDETSSVLGTAILDKMVLA